MNANGFGWQGGNTGGSVATGVLQLQNGVALDTTLRSVTDQANTASPLQLSTTKLAFAGFSGATTADIVWQANTTLTDYTGWHTSGGDYRILTKNASPLFLNTSWGINFYAGFSSTNSSSLNSSGNWNIGHAATNSARLHVRGDGTNPIARFENATGTDGLRINAAGNLIYSVAYANTAIEFLDGSINLYTNSAPAVTKGYLSLYGRTSTNTSGTVYGVDLGGLSLGSTGFTFAAGAGSANFRPLNIAYTINNSGAQTGTATGIFLNATETALNSMTHNLFDYQVSSISRLRLSKVSADTYLYMSTTNRANGLTISYIDSGHVAQFDYANILRFTRGGSFYPIVLDASGQVAMNNLNSLAATLTVSGYTTNDIQRWYASDTTTLYSKVTSAGVIQSVAYSMDAQRFKFNNGAFGTNHGYMKSVSDGNFVFSNAGETSFSSLKFGTTTSSGLFVGSGSPEGVVTAAIGSIYMRSDGGASTSIYVKESGTGNTGWVAK